MYTYLRIYFKHIGGVAIYWEGLNSEEDTDKGVKTKGNKVAKWNLATSVECIALCG